MRREHNEDADDMSEQRMSRATKLGDANHLRSSREEANLNAGASEERLYEMTSVVENAKRGLGLGRQLSAYFLDEAFYAGLDPEPNLKIGERV